jgi:predicted metal-dependent hydrolase
MARPSPLASSEFEAVEFPQNAFHDRSENLVLNSELAQASPHLIDYVIAHELAHALNPNHGSEWQGLLNQTMPDWRGRKDELEMQLL